MKKGADHEQELESVYLNMLEDMQRQSKELVDARRAQLNIMDDLEQRRKLVEAREKELKNTQAMLIQAGKMAAMGELGAGIAHELNQPLAAIRGFAQLFLREMALDDPRRKDIRLIEEQTTRMSQIVNNIRGFSRQQIIQSELIDVHKPIEDALMLLATQLRSHNIKVVTEFDRDVPMVHADSNNLQQVFINLLSNARDELVKQGGGTIVIASASKEAADGTRDVELLVRDNGPGIPKEIKDRLFDPFFTTKQQGKGTGLGLSISFRIIRDHGGNIEMGDAVGGGAEVKITLPIGARDQDAA